MKLSASVITIDRNSQRFKDFQRHNAHLQYNIFPGILGRDIPVSTRIEKKFVTAEAAASGLIKDGRFGCAMSHWTLWREAANNQTGMLIMEDDVITHPDLWKHILTISDLTETDMVLFGLNTNSVLEAITPEGLRKLSHFQPLHPDTKWITTTLSNTKIQNVRYSRLLRCFGLCCYFVSPKGAKILSDSLFPLRLDGVEVPFITKNMPGIGCDRRLNALYDSINAFVAEPFLAYTPNLDSMTAQ